MTLHQQLVCHFKLDKGQHLYTYKCVERPRLRVNKSTRNGRVLERSYWLADDPDGRYFDTPEAAIAALDELEALEKAS